MRKITLNADGELVVIENGEGSSHIDYSRIATNQFVDSAGNAYRRYGVLTDYSNEIFINHFVRKLEWRALIQTEDRLIKAEQNDIIHLLWNEVVEETSSPRKKSSKSWSILAWLKLFLAYVACLGIVLSRKLKNLGSNNRSLYKIAVVRSNATYSKLRSVEQSLSITLLSEDIVYQNSKLKSIFSVLSFGQCLNALCRAIVPTITEFGCLIRELETVFDSKVAAKLICSYSSRVVLKCTFEQLLMILLKANNVPQLVTGNKEDRFAMAEKRLCSKLGITLTCIPHGLEYAYCFPTGIAGDVFYCTSDRAKTVLSILYPTVFFIYDEYLQRLMYRITEKSFIESEPINKVVFFTESRDIEVNRKIIDELTDMGLEFYVRLHPKDSESNYLDKSIVFHDNYAEAICNSLCICRKSTVLLEALYNNSLPIAYLINSKDRYYVFKIFPSLNSVNIHKCLDKESLAQLILAS